MRALLVVNPAATTTSARTRDVLIHALASEMKLEVVTTEYRGHARDLGRRAADGDDMDLVVALGGDGTVNEVVNGLLHGGPGPERLPGLAVVPGGSTNVFARALGLPNDPVEATGALLDALRHGRERVVGLGLAEGTPGTEDASVPARWFTFNAGLGFDAGVVGRVEQQRELGRTSTHALYVHQVLRQFLGEPNRRRGTITLERETQESRQDRQDRQDQEDRQDQVDRQDQEGTARIEDLVVAIVSNTSPWTYLGNRPMYTSPKASFDKGIDVFGLRRLSAASVARYGTQLLTSSPQRGPHGRHVVSLHDLDRFTLQSKVPLPLQMDGDHLGLRTSVTFTGVRRALRVIV
jgi:diacylglycerol kinase family enzyme